MVDALMTVIEAILRFFQVKIKRMLGHPVELHQATLGITPKALDAVDVNVASGELVVAVVDPQMLVKADIDQAVIAAPAVRVNHAGNIGLASDDGLKDDLGGIRNDFRINVLAAFEQTKDHRLLTRATAAKSANPARSKVGLIGFELTAQRRDLLAVVGKPTANAQINGVDRAKRHAAEFGAIGGSQIHGEVAQDLAKLRFTDL